jgi:predicted Zn-dependent protease with MMP-like domain
MKVTKEAFALAEQYWKARLANDMEELEELISDQADALSEEVGVDMSNKIINASNRIDVAESILNKLNKLKND